MEWKTKILCEGDVRERTFFAWFPITVTKGKFCITRWLERVTVEESFRENFDSGFWVIIKFIEKGV